MTTAETAELPAAVADAIAAYAAAESSFGVSIGAEEPQAMREGCGVFACEKREALELAIRKAIDDARGQGACDIHLGTGGRWRCQRCLRYGIILADPQRSDAEHQEAVATRLWLRELGRDPGWTFERLPRGQRRKEAP